MAANDPILTVAQMRAAEQALIDGGETVASLMERAGRGAADWVWRMAGGRPVTVLCGPGNNGGDGYVIARELQRRGSPVTLVAPIPPATDAARAASDSYAGPRGAGQAGGVLVDCLFGSGLTRKLAPEMAALLRDLAERNPMRIAVDLPSGVDADAALALGDWRPPAYDLTIALGAWKFAHWQLPARLLAREYRLVDIGIGEVAGAARLIARPALAPPGVEDHKYSRGLCAIVGGAMPGAALLACMAAMRGGAGYVKLLAESEPQSAPADLVVDGAPVDEALRAKRPAAVLVGPGLGRDDAARGRLGAALAAGAPLVLDADALHLLTPGMKLAGAVATPHHGELAVLCRAFGVEESDHRARAAALARASGMVVVAKGPDSLVAAPDGALAVARPAPPWLSVAGTGDVLAGLIASRRAAGRSAFEAACEGVWLHGAAARLTPAPFTAGELALSIPAAIRSCL